MNLLQSSNTQSTTDDVYGARSPRFYFLVVIRLPSLYFNIIDIFFVCVHHILILVFFVVKLKVSIEKNMKNYPNENKKKNLY